MTVRQFNNSWVLYAQNFYLCSINCYLFRDGHFHRYYNSELKEIVKCIK